MPIVCEIIKPLPSPDVRRSFILANQKQHCSLFEDDQFQIYFNLIIPLYYIKGQDEETFLSSVWIREEICKRMSTKERANNVKEVLLKEQRQGKDVIPLQSAYYNWKLAQDLITQNSVERVNLLTQNEVLLLLKSIFSTRSFTACNFLHLLANQEEILDLGKTKVHQQINILEALIQKFPQSNYNSNIPYFRAIYTDQQITPACPISLFLENGKFGPVRILLDQILSVHPANFSSNEVAEVLPKLYKIDSLHNSLVTQILRTFEQYEFTLYLDSRLFNISDNVGSLHKIFTFNESNVLRVLKQNEQHIQPVDCIPAFLSEIDSLVVDFSLGENHQIKDEINFEIQVLDVALSFNQTKSVIQCLSQIDNYSTVMGGKVVQEIIQYKWRKLKPIIIWFLFGQYLLLLGAFIAYSNVFNGQLDSSEETNIDGHRGELALAIIITYFSCFFLIWEVVQMTNSKTDSFKQSLIWNFADFLPSALAITVVTIRTFIADEEPSKFIDTVHSLTSLLLWVKLLYFMRIFESTGYYIQIIMGSFWDMKEFLLILFIVQIGFGEAFLRLSERSEDDGAFLRNFAEAFVYSFRMGLGDNNTDPYESITQPIFAWILFISCSVFTGVVMLNILISVIGQSFERINSQSILATFKDRADLISENDVFNQTKTSIFTRFGGGLFTEEFICPKEDPDKPNWLILFKQVSGGTQDVANEEDLANQIKSVKGQIGQLNSKLDSVIEAIGSLQKEQRKENQIYLQSLIFLIMNMLIRKEIGNIFLNAKLSTQLGYFALK